MFHAQTCNSCCRKRKMVFRHFWNCPWNVHTHEGFLLFKMPQLEPRFHTLLSRTQREKKKLKIEYIYIGCRIDRWKGGQTTFGSIHSMQIKNTGPSSSSSQPNNFSFSTDCFSKLQQTLQDYGFSNPSKIVDSNILPGPGYNSMRRKWELWTQERETQKLDFSPSIHQITFLCPPKAHIWHKKEKKIRKTKRQMSISG